MNRIPMLEGKRADIFGAGGSIGSAVGKEFAAEGAKVFLAGRTTSNIDAVSDRRSRRSIAFTSECPVNCEWHEFGHALFAWRINTAGSGGTNHFGFINPDSGDSVDEGFAGFWGTAMAEVYASKQPDSALWAPPYINPYGNVEGTTRKATVRSTTTAA